MKPTRYSAFIYLTSMLLLAWNGYAQAADYDEAVFTPVTQLDVRLNPEKFLDKPIRLTGVLDARDEDRQCFILYKDGDGTIRVFYKDVSREAEKRLILTASLANQLFFRREAVVFGYLKKNSDSEGLYIRAVGFKMAELGKTAAPTAPASPPPPRSTPTPPSQIPPQGRTAPLPRAADPSAINLEGVCPKGQLGEFRHGTKCVGYYNEKGLVDIQVAGKATSKEYVSTKSLVHGGVDIAAPEGSDVFPIADGTVDDVIINEKDTNFSKLGYMVLIEHKNKLNGKPTYSLYLHLKEKPSVAVGGIVVAGKTLLGKVGASGAAFGPHLHLEVRHFATRLSPQWGNIYGIERPSSEAKFDETDFQKNWIDPEKFGAGTGDSPASTGVSSGAGTPATPTEPPVPKSLASLEQQLKELLGRSPRVPDQPDRILSDEKKGVTISYPAEFEMRKDTYPVVARFYAPASSTPEANRANIVATCSPTPLLNRNPSLESAIAPTISGTRSTMANATLTSLFKTTLAGAEARIFFVTGTEDGVLRQKAVTVAVCRKHILGVVLHATPETFQKHWDAYRRVCNSYELR